MKNKVWFITGASKGLGLVLAKELLKAGYSVAATSRKKTDLEKAISITTESFLPLQVDINNDQSVEAGIQATVDHFGSIDVVVNNAGYGLLGALEELTMEESRQNFEVNVFGSLNVIRKALPYLRKQQSGHVFNVSSIGGFTGAFPGFGIYCATKFAVQGFSESLAEEVKPFGINVTIVSPGYFRTEFLTGGSLAVPRHAMQEYKNVREMQTLHQQDYNHNQPGDPVKAALVMMEAANLEQPPMHLFLGQDAYNLADVKMESVRKDMNSMKRQATATAFEA